MTASTADIYPHATSSSKSVKLPASIAIVINLYAASSETVISAQLIKFPALIELIKPHAEYSAQFVEFIASITSAINPYAT